MKVPLQGGGFDLLQVTVVLDVEANHGANHRGGELVEGVESRVMRPYMVIIGVPTTAERAGRGRISNVHSKDGCIRIHSRDSLYLIDRGLGPGLF